MNVQHNCSKHKCGTKRAKIVRQEQEDTNILAPVVQHEHPADILLNLAQMRNACHFEEFRVGVRQLDRELAIHQGASREIQAQRDKRAKGTRKAQRTRLNSPCSMMREGGSIADEIDTSRIPGDGVGGSEVTTPASVPRRTSSNGSVRRSGTLLRTVLNARTHNQTPALRAEENAERPSLQTTIHMAQRPGAQASYTYPHSISRNVNGYPVVRGDDRLGASTQLSGSSHGVQVPANMGQHLHFVANLQSTYSNVSPGFYMVC